MQQRPMLVNKKLACPACSAENRVRFEYNEMLLELSCSECGTLIVWKKRPFGSGVRANAPVIIGTRTYLGFISTIS